MRRAAGCVEAWSVAYCCAGALLLGLSVFVPRWRLDEHGTSDLERRFNFAAGFPTRSYGLLHVQGTYSQSWRTLATSTCSFRDLSHVSALGQTVVKLFGGAANETANESASAELSSRYLVHMDQRCRSYENLLTISSVTLAFTFVSIVMVLCGFLLFALASCQRTSCLVALLFVLAGTLSLLVNALWALASDHAFKSLMATAWYPYPSMAIGYWLHLYGGVTVLVAGATFGYLALGAPDADDSARARLARRKDVLSHITGVQAQSLYSQRDQMWQLQQQQQPAPMMPPQHHPALMMSPRPQAAVMLSPRAQAVLVVPPQPQQYSCSPPPGYGSGPQHVHIQVTVSPRAVAPPPQMPHPVQYGTRQSDFGLPPPQY